MSRHDRYDVIMDRRDVMKLRNNPDVIPIHQYIKADYDQAGKHEYFQMHTPIGKIHFHADAEHRIELLNIRMALEEAINKHCRGNPEAEKLLIDLHGIQCYVESCLKNDY